MRLTREQIIASRTYIPLYDAVIDWKPEVSMGAVLRIMSDSMWLPDRFWVPKVQVADEQVP